MRHKETQPVEVIPTPEVVDKGKLKEEILNYIACTTHVSFAELSRNIEGFDGDWALYTQEKYPNVILWPNLSLTAADAMIELLSIDRTLIAEPCRSFIYVIDGLVPSLPIVKRVQGYKKPHWLPVTLNAAQPETNQDKLKEALLTECKKSCGLSLTAPKGGTNEITRKA